MREVKRREEQREGRGNRRRDEKIGEGKRR